MAVPSRRAGNFAGLLACSIIFAGCSKPTETTHLLATGHYQQPVRFDDIYRSRSPEVVRYDRYTLVSTRPMDAQLDPLNQIVDITMPAQLVKSVGEGFRYLLLESGYSQCSATSSAFSELLSRPLPAVQRTIGPVKLSEALQIVAGPAWRLKVEEVNRSICFELRDQYRSFDTPTVRVSNPEMPVAARIQVISGTLPISAVEPVTPSTTAPRNPFTGDMQGPALPTGDQKVPLTPQSLSVSSPMLQTQAAAKSTKAPTASEANAPIVLPAKTPALDSPNAFSAKPIVTPLTTVNSTKKPAIEKPVLPVTTVAPSPSSDSHIISSSPTGTPITSQPVGETWRAAPGSTLKETLNGWASKTTCANGGNWVVIWPGALDYRIDAPLVFHGNFETAVVQVFDLYSKAEKPLFAEGNRNQCLVSVSDTPSGRGH